MTNVLNERSPEQKCGVVRAIAFTKLLRNKIIAARPSDIPLTLVYFVRNAVACDHDISGFRPPNGNLPFGSSDDKPVVRIEKAYEFATRPFKPLIDGAILAPVILTNRDDMLLLLQPVPSPVRAAIVDNNDFGIAVQRSTRLYRPRQRPQTVIGWDNDRYVG
jgi:hypothetical protein